MGRRVLVIWVLLACCAGAGFAQSDEEKLVSLIKKPSAQ